MARYLAIGSAPEISEATFRETFDAVKKWRIDRHSWLVKVYCNVNNGKVAVECEAPSQEVLMDWMEKNDWNIEDVYQINLIHEGSAVWTV